MIKFNQMKNVRDLFHIDLANRKLIWGAILSCIAALFLVFYVDRDFRKDISVEKTNSYIEGLRIVNKKDGADEWIVLARRADFTKDETTAEMSGVTIDIKKEGVTLNADKGAFNLNTRDLRLQDNIKILRKDSLITARDLSWNPSKGMLSSGDKVRMECSRFELEGEGLTTADNNNTITLKRNVKAVFH